MWTFIFLYTLGLNIYQATGKDNSTQMYYVKLTIEKSAIDNITKILRPFVSNNSLTVDNLKITTTCRSNQTSKECTCEAGYTWSDGVCQSDQKCCGNNCIFTQNVNHMCISNTTVNITGLLTLNDPIYHKCLATNRQVYDKCNNELLDKMKTVYSTLSGFDNLIIKKYSVGSVIADFIMIIAAKIEPQDLSRKSINLISSLNASLVLKTSGIVKLTMPDSPVPYNSQQKLRCSTEVELGKDPVWQLKQTVVSDITNGSESKVISGTTESTVNLEKVSELWAGEYTCAYEQNSERSTIFHKASAVLDVCLLPNIYITTAPAFPRCTKSSTLLRVRIKCEIGRSTEKYNVMWKSEKIDSQISPISKKKSSKLGANPSTETYEAETFVDCNSGTPTVTCIFINRCYHTKKATIDINTINENDPYCAAEGDWEDTKVDSIAVLKCKNAAGQRQRKCNNDTNHVSTTGGEWESEDSACVNLDVNSVLESANTAGIGLGSLDQNAANVFHRLRNVTNNTHININTFANINASVQVLVSLSHKLQQINNESTADDVLVSSSNLLEKSLENSWTKFNENISLAEKYLSSVENLIQKTNITDATKKPNIQVAKSDCTQESQCTNEVFDVIVSLTTLKNDSVKTAGFKHLETYLPNKDEQYQPNSIVVSTTTKNQQTDKVVVNIDFKLLNPRPRNSKIECVSWDNSTNQWSKNGCEWVGPSNEGRCVCHHLSSFAILMSKIPLEIRFITEITYIGLSISVVSLIISLVIELIVWSTVVKTNTLYLRHIAHINISLCLLVADCCFLASSTPKKISSLWCKTSVVLKHFCYLSMFFWMLCLSIMLLHQAVFLFHNVSKKTYLRFSLVLGYVCPLLIVAITFLANKAGAEEFYFSKDTCWLVYTGFMKGSIHTFLIPVGIIVFVNVFSMLVVIMKLLDHPKNTEKSHEKEKAAAKTVMRSVILLTPIFGVTWLFGFAVMPLDLTYGNIAYAVNYAFTLLNAFQGLFILLTTCLGEKQTREALLNRLRKNASASTTDSSTKLASTLKK